MFKFIRKFFETEPKEKKFSLKEFESWFKDYTDKKIDKAAEILEEFNSRIEKNIEQTKNKLSNLEKAELKNPNIPERAKQLLYGNRESYIIKVKHFLEEFEIPKTTDDVETVIEKVETDLDLLTKSTQKSNMVLQEFLANESRDVAVAVNTIKTTLKDLNEKLIKESADLVEEIKDGLESIKNSDNKKQELKKTLAEKEEKKIRLIDTVEEIEKKIKKLESSDEFKKIKALIGDKENIKQKVNELEKNVFHVFSILEKSFKKFQRMTLDEELVKKYLENPIKAILHDTELKLFGVLGRMKEAIIKGSLELDKRKKEKTIGTIENITKEYISGFAEKYKRLLEELRRMEEKIKESKIEDDIETLKLEKDSLEKVLNKIKEELKGTKSKLENIDIKKIIRSIAEKASELTDEDIEIQ